MIKCSKLNAIIAFQDLFRKESSVTENTHLNEFYQGMSGNSSLKCRESIAHLTHSGLFLLHFIFNYFYWKEKIKHYQSMEGQHFEIVLFNRYGILPEIHDFDQRVSNQPEHFEHNDNQLPIVEAYVLL
jgi:hypothetical protein